MKFRARALGVGLAAIMAVGSYSVLTAAEGGAPPVLQPVITKIETSAGAPGAPEGIAAGAAIAPAPAGGEQPGGPAVGGPAVGGPVVEGPAPVEAPAPPAIVHHFIFAESWDGYGAKREFKMELILFVDGTFKMLAPEFAHGYYGHAPEWTMVEWLGAWHLDDDVLCLEYKQGGENSGFITVAKEGLRLRMDGHRWIDILTVKS